MRQRANISDDLPPLLVGELVLPRGHNRALRAKWFNAPAFADAPEKVLRRKRHHSRTVREICRCGTERRTGGAFAVAAQAVAGNTIRKVNFPSCGDCRGRVQNVIRWRNARVLGRYRISGVGKTRAEAKSPLAPPLSHDFYPRHFAPARVHDVHRARHAGIEGMHRAQNFNRAFGIAHGVADERFFPCAAFAGRIAR